MAGQDDGSPDFPQMSAEEAYAFDLLGYVVVRGALSPAQLKLANEAVDNMELEASPSYTRGSSALAGAGTGITRLGYVGGLLDLPPPYCTPFREMLAHPATTPHLNTILGEGWRHDHGPGLIAMDQGCEGGHLHGGATAVPASEQYFFKNGQMMTGLTVVEYLLSDEGPGD